jgi:hypothetical protein
MKKTLRANSNLSVGGVDKEISLKFRRHGLTLFAKAHQARLFVHKFEKLLMLSLI